MRLPKVLLALQDSGGQGRHEGAWLSIEGLEGQKDQLKVVSRREEMPIWRVLIVAEGSP
jgi:hypothetical protein